MCEGLEKEKLERLEAGLCVECGKPVHPAARVWCESCANYYGYMACSLCGKDMVREDEGICYDCWLKTNVREDLERRVGIRIEPGRSYKVVVMQPEEGFAYRFVVPQSETDVDGLVSRAQAALARMYNSPVSVQIETITGKWLLMCYHSSKEFGNERYYYALSNEAVTALEAA